MYQATLIQNKKQLILFYSFVLECSYSARQNRYISQSVTYNKVSLQVSSGKKSMQQI